MSTVTRRSLLAGLAASLLPAGMLAQRRRAVKVTRTRVVIHREHPVRRAVNRTVIVRPARKTVVVAAPLVYLPVVVFAATVTVLPPRERLIWQDTESIEQDEDWVECNFGVDDRGSTLYLGVDGRAQLDFADITFENGEVQVVDFKERTYSDGTYQLLAMPSRRQVKTVRLLAKSKTRQATLRIYLG